MAVSSPKETKQYRTARNKLLDAQIALRRKLKLAC
jgi:predicted dithiol-disulfide oxidoreductase (DUF899 family)